MALTSVKRQNDTVGEDIGTLDIGTKKVQAVGIVNPDGAQIGGADSPLHVQGAVLTSVVNALSAIETALGEVKTAIAALGGGGSPLAVSAASLPLPANAAQETDGNLEAILAKLLNYVEVEGTVSATPDRHTSDQLDAITTVLTDGTQVADVNLRDGAGEDLTSDLVDTIRSLNVFMRDVDLLIRTLSSDVFARGVITPDLAGRLRVAVEADSLHAAHTILSSGSTQRALQGGVSPWTQTAANSVSVNPWTIDLYWLAASLASVEYDSLRSRFTF